MTNRFVIGVLAATAASALFGSALRAQQAPRLASSGVFTADQAQRGHAVYFKDRTDCHRHDLTGQGGRHLSEPTF